MAYSYWFHQDQLLLHAIIALTSESVMPLVASAKTSHEAWNKLLCLFASKSHSRVMSLKKWLVYHKINLEPWLVFVSPKVIGIRALVIPLLKFFNISTSTSTSTLLCDSCRCNRGHKLPSGISSLSSSRPLDLLLYWCLGSGSCAISWWVKLLCNFCWLFYKICLTFIPWKENQMPLSYFLNSKN